MSYLHFRYPTLHHILKQFSHFFELLYSYVINSRYGLRRDTHMHSNFYEFKLIRTQEKWATRQDQILLYTNIYVLY